jgi:hypothetical protein
MPQNIAQLLKFLSLTIVHLLGLVAYIDYPWLHYMEAIFALALSCMAPRGPQYNFTLRFAFTMLLNAAMANVITFNFNYTCCLFAAKFIWLPLTGFTIGYYKTYLSREILPFITDISTFLGISTENTDPEKATSGPPTPPTLPRFDAKKK